MPLGLLGAASFSAPLLHAALSRRPCAVAPVAGPSSLPGRRPKSRKARYDAAFVSVVPEQLVGCDSPARARWRDASEPAGSDRPR